MHSLSPGANGVKTQDGCPPEFSRVEILMGDCVAPIVQLIEAYAPGSVPGIMCFEVIPEDQPKTIEIRPDVSRIRVPTINFAVLAELDA